MKAIKYSQTDTSKIDLGHKIIYKYPSPTKLMDIARMEINGRHPENPHEFLLEHDCQFVLYVTKGEGKIYAADETFNVTVGDVVFVPTETPFAVDGTMEYVTVDVPAFYIEQSETIIESD